jgi:hypothetical protein
MGFVALLEAMGFVALLGLLRRGRRCRRSLAVCCLLAMEAMGFVALVLKQWASSRWFDSVEARCCRRRGLSTSLRDVSAVNGLNALK